MTTTYVCGWPCLVVAFPWGSDHSLFGYISRDLKQLLLSRSTPSVTEAWV